MTRAARKQDMSQTKRGGVSISDLHSIDFYDFISRFSSYVIVSIEKIDYQGSV